MRIPRFRTIIGMISGPAIIATGLATFTLASAGPAAAGQPVTQPLTPPPPSFETCKTVGNGVICEGARTLTYGPDDTGIACGSGAGAFDIFDQGTHNQHAIRFYNTDGNLVRRVIYDQYFSQFSNPLTGVAVPYTQHNTTTDVLAVPGDFGSATETTTGQNNFTVPHLGAVLLNAGKVVFGADGTLEFSAGPQGFLDYFYNGNTAALAELCTALGQASPARHGRLPERGGLSAPFISLDLGNRLCLASGGFMQGAAYCRGWTIGGGPRPWSPKPWTS